MTGPVKDVRDRGIQVHVCEPDVEEKNENPSLFSWKTGNNDKKKNEVTKGEDKNDEKDQTEATQTEQTQTEATPEPEPATPEPATPKPDVPKPVEPEPATPKPIEPEPERKKIKLGDLGDSYVTLSISGKFFFVFFV